MHVLYRMTYSDQEAAKRKLDRGLVRRVGHYAKPYQGMLIGFLVTIVLEALLSLAPPLLFKAIVDNAIADKDTRCRRRSQPVGPRGALLVGPHR